VMPNIVLLKSQLIVISHVCKSKSLKEGILETKKFFF
jgi:hypothetical protein